MTDERRRELAVLLACCDAVQRDRVPWWQVARAAQRAGSMETLIGGPWDPQDRWEYQAVAALARHLTPALTEQWAVALDGWVAADARLTFHTVLDHSYPASLRLVFNQPPFITTRGELIEADNRGVAVVGTRTPSEEGVRRAKRLAHELAKEGITVHSGLARGIDTAAHRAALDAGGRSVAVLGHGLLEPVYPRENAPLAERIATRGALVSQFRPDAPPTRYTFGMRNAVTSGLSQGTVVVEAGRTSGARMQARLAAEHGKRVWLLRSLVERFDWARAFLDRHSDQARLVSCRVSLRSGTFCQAGIRRIGYRLGVPVDPASLRRRNVPLTSRCSWSSACPGPSAAPRLRQACSRSDFDELWKPTPPFRLGAVPPRAARGETEFRGRAFGTAGLEFIVPPPDEWCRVRLGPVPHAGPRPARRLATRLVHRGRLLGD